MMSERIDFGTKAGEFISLTVNLLGKRSYSINPNDLSLPSDLSQLASYQLNSINRIALKHVLESVGEVIELFSRGSYPELLLKLEEIKRITAEVIRDIKAPVVTGEAIFYLHDVGIISRIRIWTVVCLYDLFYQSSSNNTKNIGDRNMLRRLQSQRDTECQQIFQEMLQCGLFKEALQEILEKKKSIFRFLESQQSITERFKILQEISSIRIRAGYCLAKDREVLCVSTHTNTEFTALVPSPIKLNTGYKKAISAMIIYQGDTLITASYGDGKLCVFDLYRMTLKRTVLTGHSGSIIKLAIHDSATDRLPRLYTMGGSDYFIKSWVLDFDCFDQRKTFKTAKKGQFFRHWAFNKNKMFTLCRSGEIRVWDVDSTECIALISPGPNLPTVEGSGSSYVSTVNPPVFSNFILSPGGDRILATHSDGLVRVWDVSDRTNSSAGPMVPREIGFTMKPFPPSDLNNFDTKLLLLQRSNDNDWLLSLNASADMVNDPSKAIIPVFRAGKDIFEKDEVALPLRAELIPGEAGVVNCFAVTDVHSLLFTGHSEGYVMVWDYIQSVPSTIKTIVCYPKQQPVCQIAVAGKFLCTSGGNKGTSVKLWNWRASECLMSVSLGSVNCVYSLIIQDGLLYVGGSSEVRVYVL